MHKNLTVKLLKNQTLKKKKKKKHQSWPGGRERNIL